MIHNQTATPIMGRTSCLSQKVDFSLVHRRLVK